MRDIPIKFIWDGEVMKPLDRLKRYCDKKYAVGEVYPLVVEYDRSTASHRHYFAVLNDVWMTLPPNLAELFPTSERLRKWCLIKCGYAVERRVVLDTVNDSAQVVSILSSLNEDAVIVQSGTILKVFTAESQSANSMTKDKFQESKDAVFGVLAEMLGVTVAEMLANTGQTE